MKKFRIILLVFNILAALGLIATTLAGIVPPSKSMLPSVLTYGFLPMLLLNILLAIVWALMRRWEALISVGTILIRVTYIGFFFQIGGTSEAPSREEHPEMVTLMSFNVHHFSGTEFVTSPKIEHGNAFLQLLREEKPDILCLQEYGAVANMSINDSLKALGYIYFYGARGNENPHGTVVFSKLPIVSPKNIDNEKVLMDIQHGKRTFRLCCVHMDSYQFNQDDRDDIERMRHGKIDSTSRRTFSKAKETVRQHETEWKTLLSPVVTGSSLPMLLAGDMNDIPGSWLYGQITDYLDDTYRDEGSGFGPTYIGSTPHFRIDMVFRSKEFSTLSYKRIETDISDHYPILVSLELNDK